jgi:histidine triad (HIT) family protein
MPTLFTRIINQEIPSHKIYEDENTYVFLTIEPLYEWHTLVVPKIALDKWYDHSHETLGQLMQTAQYISIVLEKAFHAERVALLIEWLEVPHTHLHLIPLPAWKWLAQSQKSSPTNETLKNTAEKIKKYL